MLDDAAPIHVVVMGVAGSGKSTIATALGHRLGAEAIEGDDHHPPSNVAKMAAGIPLTDADRAPWLRALAALMAERHTASISTVLACSALRRAYRDILRAGLPGGSVFCVHLAGDEATLRERMRGREHFMPAGLLDSQLATLEPLGADESGVIVDVESAPAAVTEAAVEAVGRWLRSTRA